MNEYHSTFPLGRGRRQRISNSLRDMVQETHLGPEHLIAPLFVMEGNSPPEPINSMPGYFRYSLIEAINVVRNWYQKGIRSVLLFVKVPESKKDNNGNEAINPEGFMPKAISAIKKAVPEIYLMTDVALDPYSEVGHDGLVEGKEILNDASVNILAKMALLHAQAGADAVAPSDMMDGRIGAIRKIFEANDLPHIGIMAYTAKYASALYGPFREALDSAPGFGDKKTYQLNPANRREALLETQWDVSEGADILMVKPGSLYLDILWQIRQHCHLPLSIYHVSGEYAMLKAAAEKGWINEKETVLETMRAFRRAGANLIATYYASDLAEWIK